MVRRLTRKRSRRRRRTRRRTRRGGKQRFKISDVPPLGTIITVHYKTDTGEEKTTGEVGGIHRHRRNSPPKLKLLIKIGGDGPGHALHMRHRSLNRERRMAARIQKLIPLADIIRIRKL